MDLNKVASFVQVVDSGSFTAAGRLRGQPKSSISRAVSSLETDLGVRLLQRTTRKLHLTEAGRLFYDRAARALAGLDEASAAAQQLQDTASGTVRITTVHDIGTWLLAPAIAKFRERFAHIQLDVIITPRHVDLVHENVDLALRAGALQDSSLIARPLGRLSAGIFAAPSYLRRYGVPQSLRDLQQHECLRFRSREDYADWRLSGPDGEQTLRVRGAINADGYEFLRSAVTLGLGCGLMPLFACPQIPHAQWQRVLPQYRAVGAPLHLVYPSARFVPKRVAVLRDCLLEEIPPLLDGGSNIDPVDS